MTRNTFDNIKVKDQLGKPDNLGLFGPFRFFEDVGLEELPKIVYKQTLSGSDGFILNNNTWGVLGTNTLGTPSTTVSILENQNYNDTFFWDFKFASTANKSAFGVYYSFGFTDLSNTTANEDATTNYRVDFTNGEIWQSTSIFLTQDTSIVVTSITVNTVETGTLAWEATANGGNNWESITIGTTHNFTNIGRDVRLRATSTGVSTLSEITARYEK